jgi:hypothetical protein
MALAETTVEAAARRVTREAERLPKIMVAFGGMNGKVRTVEMNGR